MNKKLANVRFCPLIYCHDFCPTFESLSIFLFSDHIENYASHFEIFPFQIGILKNCTCKDRMNRGNCTISSIASTTCKNLLVDCNHSRNYMLV